MRKVTRRLGYDLYREDRTPERIVTQQIVGLRRKEQRRVEIRDAFNDLGSVVYFIRDDDLIKIGYTGDLRTRRRAFTSDLTAILAVVPGGQELEGEIHERFVASLAKGKEWFRPTPDLIEYINEIRGRMNVPAVTFGS
jgi:hypothetical protein